MSPRVWFGPALLVAVVALPALEAPAAEGTKLEWKFKEGDTFYIEITSNTKISMEFPGAKKDSESDSVMVNKFTVLKSDKDATEIEQKIESIKNKANGGTLGADKMELLKGTTFKLTFNAKGEITKLEGYDDFVKKLGSDNEVKSIKSFMSEDALKTAAADIFAFVPEKPVSKGDSWKRPQSVTLGPLGSFKGETTYTDKGASKSADGEEIAFEQTFTYSLPKDDDLPFKITNGELKTEKASGTMVFDPTRGRLIRTDATLKMKGSLTFDSGGDTKSCNLEMQQTYKLKVLDKNPLD